MGGLLAHACMGGVVVVTATLDVFSGMPNPSWTLSADEGAKLEAWVEALPPAADIVEPPPLGYRGVIIDGGTSALAGPLTVYRGTVTGPTGTRADPDRALEMWLLDTADPPLDADLRDLVD